ncbi:hypothetical protein PO909_004155 [Leuciscus waleckii]
MDKRSNIEQQAFDAINTLTARAVDPDSAADDFIQFITQPGFETVIDLTQDGNEDPTVNVTDRPHILPDSTPARIENPIGSNDEPLPGPSGEPARKKTRKTNRPTPPRPESSPERKTLCLTPPSTPPTSPETAFFYADSSRSHEDDVTTWDTPQLNAWEQSPWTSERGEVSTTNAGQTPYPSCLPSSEEVEVEEVPAPQSADVPFDDAPPTHRLINSIESLGQEFRDAQVDINNKYIELRDVQDDINNKLIALHSQPRDRQIETHSRLDALRGELRAYHLETRSRFDVQDRFIRGLANEIFRRVNGMRSTTEQRFDRNDRMVSEYHRELVLILHHLILTIIDETTESN